MTPARILQVNARPYSRLRFDETELRATFAQLDSLEAFQAPAGELSIVFLTDNELARLHGEFLDDPSPTDVITFPGDADMDFAGEICVSVDRALTEAPKHQWSFSEELTLYLVHGWLHLAGLDDLDEANRQKMRDGENYCLESLRKNDVIPRFSVDELTDH
ncbi:MAG: rRNA maturation RNase YbeY [Verrucomicrobiota bacterium]